MLRATAFPAPNNSAAILSGTHTCPYLETTRVLYPRSSFISRFNLLQFRQHVKSLRAVRGGGLIPAAAKKKGKGKASIVEIEEDFDEEEDDDVGYEFDDDDDEDDEGEEDEDVDDEVIPVGELKKWLEKKPKGFGEGKVYDTSIEDKLFEELQKSKQAQAVNLKKLKANPIKNASKNASKNDATKKIDEKVVPVRSRVRLANLPKKRNIDRDLKAAFQGIPGISNIVPAVMGNKKTRDPICKGFAFVDFKHERDAVRFVELYTGQTITFGKIQKQIKCELVNAQSSSSFLELRNDLSTALPLLPSFEEDSNEDSNMDDSSLGTWEETDLDDSDEQRESDVENEEFVTALKLDSDNRVEMTKQVDGKKKASVKVGQENAPKKKPSTKENAKKVVDVPGSAKRLKIKEKAVLIDVFSKYGSKTSPASKDR